MGQADQLRLLLVSGLFLSSLGKDQCIYQECDCFDEVIECGYKHLTSLPPLLGTQQSNFAYLDLSMNQITTIPARSLPANLTEILLEENPIATIDDTAFDASSLTLTFLSFAGAVFTRIPDAFLHLHALRYLSFGTSNITDWNINAMKNIGQTLKQFSLLQDGLKIWPDCIQYFSHLTTLNIIGTSIEVIPDDAFKNIANSLTSLTLTRNSLTAVPKALSKLIALESLKLNANKIVDITWLPLEARLSSLVLDLNRISDSYLLSKIVSRYADSLNNLGITGNLLTVIPDFPSLQKMDQFFFDGNQINDPYSGSLPLNISALSLANNSLPAIPSIILKLKYVIELDVTSNLIRGMSGDEIPQWVKFIEIDYNFITEINDTSFPENSSLISLSMNYNPVSYISLSAFKNVPLLTEVNIQGSELTRVPLALASLVHISYVNISDSRLLICTCLEKDLGSWIKKLSQYSFSGNCGDTSVYFFFVSLSTFCPSGPRGQIDKNMFFTFDMLFGGWFYPQTRQLEYNADLSSLTRRR